MTTGCRFLSFAYWVLFQVLTVLSSPLLADHEKVINLGGGQSTFEEAEPLPLELTFRVGFNKKKTSRYFYMVFSHPGAILRFDLFCLDNSCSSGSDHGVENAPFCKPLVPPE